MTGSESEDAQLTVNVKEKEGHVKVKVGKMVILQGRNDRCSAKGEVI